MQVVVLALLKHVEHCTRSTNVIVVCLGNVSLPSDLAQSCVSGTFLSYHVLNTHFHFDNSAAKVRPSLMSTMVCHQTIVNHVEGKMHVEGLLRVFPMPW